MIHRLYVCCFSCVLSCVPLKSFLVSIYHRARTLFNLHAIPFTFHPVFTVIYLACVPGQLIAPLPCRRLALLHRAGAQWLQLRR